MTHDELLTKIDELDNFTGMNGASTAMPNALRAVVELHKPYEYKGVFKTELMCSGCELKNIEFVDYPCDTIQAIEKELK